MRLLWHGDPTTSVLISFLGILPGFPVLAWLHGFFGGWDIATLAELRGVAVLSGFVWPLVWVFWASSALGARLSPLRNRFSITICRAALEEAARLAREKVLL